MYLYIVYNVYIYIYIIYCIYVIYILYIYLLYIIIFIVYILTSLYFVSLKLVCKGCYLTFFTWRCVELTLQEPSYPTYTVDPYNSPFERGNTSSYPRNLLWHWHWLWSKLKHEQWGENFMHSFKMFLFFFGTDKGFFLKVPMGRGGPLRCNRAILYFLFLSRKYDIRLPTKHIFLH